LRGSSREPRCIARNRTAENRRFSFISLNQADFFRDAVPRSGFFVATVIHSHIELRQDLPPCEGWIGRKPFSSGWSLRCS
jgi:hypothetical protein